MGAAVVTLDGGAGPTAAAKKPGRAPTGSTTWLVLLWMKNHVCKLHIITTDVAVNTPYYTMAMFTGYFNLYYCIVITELLHCQCYYLFPVPAN